MKAIRWHGRGDVRLDDVPPPDDPAPGEVLLEVVLCGVCGTDLEEVRLGPLTIPVQPHALTGVRAPLTMGHEVLGRVHSLGPGVRGLAIGDRVVPDGLEWCGDCDACRAGAHTLCHRLASIGLHRDGGMAEYLVVPAAGCIPISPDVPDTVAVLVEPLAVAVRAVRRAELTDGDRVLVIGVGAIGQCVAMLALRETAHVSVVDRDPRRVAVLRRAAPAVRADIRPSAEQVAECVIDCAGTAASFAAALGAVTPGGRLVLVGAAANVEFSPLAATLKEVTIVTSLSHDIDLDTRPAADLLERRELDLSGIVTDVVAIDDAVSAVFRSYGPEGGVPIKTAISPRGRRV